MPQGCRCCDQPAYCIVFRVLPPEPVGKAMLSNSFLVQNMQRLGQANREALPHLKELRRAPIKPSEGIVLCNVRDEIDLLPHFLKHYRQIGVKRFAFVDNGSTDQTLPFLLDQSDCDVFQFTGSFKPVRLRHGLEKPSVAHLFACQMALQRRC